MHSGTKVPIPGVATFERPGLLIFCGLAGLIAMAAPLLTMIVASFIAEHDFVADTLSDLARGRHKWIMDIGFYINAGGLLALAVAAAHVHLGRIGWSIGVFCLALTALVVVLLGLWDKFDADATDPANWSIHTRLSILLGPLYLAGPLLMARGASAISRAYRRLFVAASLIWVVLAVLYWLAPNAWDGIVEKAALAATLLWTLSLSWLFYVRGRKGAWTRR